MPGVTGSLAILAAASESDLLAARNQMALSLGWHIVLSCFGVAFPAVIFVMHRRGLRDDDEVALELARRWSKVAAVLFAIGAVSGTILSFELGLLWPVLMEDFGDVIGLPFALEGIAFFIEAIFLGIYLYGWKSLPGRLHLMMLVPIMIAGVAGTFFIVSVNGWMNSPSGFSVVDGQVTDVDPLAAMFNSAVPLQFVHMFLAAVMVVGFTTASVYAVGMLRGRRDRLHRLGFIVPFVFAAIATPIQPLVGHFAGQRIADDQPVKLAAIEGLAETEDGAGVVIGGIFDGDGISYGFELPIPGLLSFLAQNDPDATVIGLGSVPDSERPPVNIVRFSFQLMVTIGTLLVALVAWFAWSWRRTREIPGSPWFLRAVAASGVASIVALEVGWVTTEVGRQPWIVNGVLRTRDAVTDASWIWLSFSVLVVIYAAMTVGATLVIRSMSRRWAAGETDLQTPYGPPGALADAPVGSAR
ncbi:MAG: cytochrome ubiquinol oxidase subunit I [Acidimicrobiia bacterium]|nr:cytochrome ubiquinol oxidase subunit I [Acidimicrobiia bacterium]